MLSGRILATIKVQSKTLHKHPSLFPTHPRQSNIGGSDGIDKDGIFEIIPGGRGGGRVATFFLHHYHKSLGVCKQERIWGLCSISISKVFLYLTQPKQGLNNPSTVTADNVVTSIVIWY